MGAGIAQVAAQAGHPVRLFDTRDGAAPAACEKLAATLAGLVAKGKIDGAEAKATRPAISAAARLDDAAGCGLVVEAIVENVDAKRAPVRDLEAIVGADCVLASNTSSMSITALANGLKRPGRAGRHALLQPGAADEAGRGGLGPADRCRRSRRRSSSWPALGQDAGACALDAGLHRQPHRPAVLRRGARAAARARRRRRRRSTPACAAPAFAWGRAS